MKRVVERYLMQHLDEHVQDADKLIRKAFDGIDLRKIIVNAVRAEVKRRVEYDIRHCQQDFFKEALKDVRAMIDEMIGE